MPLEPNQLDLFSEASLKSTPTGRPPALLMDGDALKKWKTQIAAYQQRTRESQPVQQVTLFDLAPPHVDPDTVDPFTLRLCPMSFYRLPDSSPGDACILCNSQHLRRCFTKHRDVVYRFHNIVRSRDWDFRSQGLSHGGRQKSPSRRGLLP